MADNQYEKLLGFDIIGSMSREALIAEILEVQRQIMSDDNRMSLNDLKRTVIGFRIQLAQERLFAEAKLDDEGPTGILGLLGR